jgi:hypothetical protein
MYRNFEVALLFEDVTTVDRGLAEVVNPDVEKSRPGEVLTGRMERFKGWVWDKLTYFL